MRNDGDIAFWLLFRHDDGDSIFLSFVAFKNVFHDIHFRRSFADRKSASAAVSPYI